VGLVALLRAHSDALEADLQRFYGVDLGDLWRGRLSLRRLSALVRYLPPGSAVWSIQSGVTYGYTPTDLFLSDLFYALTGEEHPEKPRSGPRSTKASKAKDAAARLLAQRERLARSDS
jgi:hypothetical protein